MFNRNMFKFFLRPYRVRTTNTVLSQAITFHRPKAQKKAKVPGGH